MAEKKGLKEGEFLTPVFRVSFPAVFAPRAAVVGAEPKFSIAMLFPKVITEPTEKAKFEAIKGAVTAAAIAKWGADKAKWPKSMQTPWHDGTEKDYEGYGPDIIYATASTKQKPGVVDANLQDIISKEEFYGGCYARAIITVYAYDNVKKGVSFGLRHIQKIKDGEMFSGSGKPQDSFDAITPPAGDAAAIHAESQVADPLGI